MSSSSPIARRHPSGFASYPNREKPNNSRYPRAKPCRYFSTARRTSYSPPAAVRNATRWTPIARTTSAARQDGRIDLQKIGLGEDGTAAEGRSCPESASRAPKISIPVKILVDEEEPGRPGIWEQRLRRRVEAASAIFEKNFRVGFHVAAIGTWKSDNSITDFFDALAEFEQKVDPSPAKIAIGFTSQWSMARGRIHMAGTRGPLHAHILVREGSPQINEPERLEFLVHELGHYLGAAHSPERQSVMRPVLGDNRAGRSDFRHSIRSGKRAHDRHGHRRDAPLEYHEGLAASILDPKAARADLPASWPARCPKTRPASNTPGSCERMKRRSRCRRARCSSKSSAPRLRTSALPLTVIEGSKQPARREGDALTAYYVREAAQAASALPSEVAVQAFLLGVGDRFGQLRHADEHSGSSRPLANGGISQRASDSPGRAGQADDARPARPHAAFFLCGFQTAATSADTVQTALLDAELSKAQRPTGFSFKVIAADRAGSRFGRSLVDKRFSLRLLATDFEVASYMPEIDSLPDGISAKDLKSQYGAKTDPRFVKRLKEIDQSVLASSRLSHHEFGLRPLVALNGRLDHGGVGR